MAAVGKGLTLQRVLCALLSKKLPHDIAVITDIRALDSSFFFCPHPDSFYALAIMGTTKPDIPKHVMDRWQRVVDLIADLANVPAGLIMRTLAPDHFVFVTSRTENNPYEVGRGFELQPKLYCQGVISNDGELVVEDAACDPHWVDNPDMDHGMSFYIGYPLKWPDGTLFGTICVLDRKNNRRALQFRNGLLEFCNVIEADLAMLEEVDLRKRLESTLQETLDQLEARVEKRTDALQEANGALRVLVSQMESTRADHDEQMLRQIKGFVMPHVQKLRQAISPDSPAFAHLDLLESSLKSISSDLSDSLTNAFEVLTPTEIEIAQMIMSGRSTKEIARIMARGTSTIDFHRNNIRKKLGVTDRGLNLRTHLMSLS